MSYRALTVSELARLATSSDKALTASQLLAASPALQDAKRDDRSLATDLSCVFRSRNWKRFLSRRIGEDGALAYWYNIEVKQPPQLSPMGRIRHHHRRVSETSRRHRTPGEYKLEISGHDLLVSKTCDGDTAARIVALLFNRSGGHSHD